MADLYERLKRFKKNTTQGSNSGTSETQPVTPPKLPESLKDIPGLYRARDLVGIAVKREQEKKQYLETIGVAETENEHGAYGLRHVFYPASDLLYPPEDITGFELSLLTRDEKTVSMSAKDILFIDTETTGLAGGTGTVPFLVGVGFFEQNGFCVRQYLMRDYNEEPAVLHEVNALIKKYPAVSSYNGKCFDAPLLQARFLLNRMRSRITEMPHADFLFPARRFWRSMLPNCTLMSVESHITGRVRKDDIPGEQIPYVYFDFLRGLRMQRMRPVLNHNADDILTLAFIASRMCRMLRLPPPTNMQGLELAAAGTFYAAHSDWDQAFFYLNRALEKNDFSLENRFSIQKRLSLIYKKMERYSDACTIWRIMTQEHEDFFAYIELAKFYEHKEKNISMATRFTEEVLAQADHFANSMNMDSSSFQTIKQKLLHRLNRLSRKASDK
jgi:uncharacterized protein